MKINNKKGDISAEVIFMIPKIIFLTAVLLAVVILVKVFIITTIDVRQTESNILIERILNSRDVSYFDDGLKRVYPGIIDIDKFKHISAANPNILDNAIISYGSNNQIISARMTLKQEKKDNIVAFYNKAKFDDWEPRVLSTVKGGAGSVKAFAEQKYVLVRENGQLSPAILEFYVIG